MVVYPAGTREECTSVLTCSFPPQDASFFLCILPRVLYVSLFLFAAAVAEISCSTVGSEVVNSAKRRVYVF